MAINAGFGSNVPGAKGGNRRELKPNEFDAKPGVYTVRFFPRDMDEYDSPEGPMDLAFHYLFHYRYDKPDGEAIFNIPCPKTDGPYKECYICKEGWELYEAGDKVSSLKIIKQTRSILNIMDLTTSESVAKGIQWWAAPHKKVYEEIKKLILNPAWQTEGKSVIDILFGHNFTLEIIAPADKKNGFTDYKLTADPHSFDATPYLSVMPDYRVRINELKAHLPKTPTNAELKAMIGILPTSESSTPHVNHQAGTTAPSGPIAPPPGVAVAPVAPPIGTSAPVPPPMGTSGTQASQNVPPPLGQGASTDKPPFDVNPECFGNYAIRETKCTSGSCASTEACRKKYLTGN